jgi:hypothetical protein
MALAAIRIRAELAIEYARFRLAGLPAAVRSLPARLRSLIADAIRESENTPDDVAFALVAMPIVYAAMVGAMLVGGP